MANGNSIFQDALAKFERRLTHEELEEFRKTGIQDVRRAIADIQFQQVQRKEMMNFNRISTFLEGMEQLAKVIEVFLNVNEIVAFIWGPLKFVLQTASTWKTSFDTLLDAYEEIGDTLPLLGQYEKIFLQSPHMKRVLELIYTDILEFHQRAFRFFRDRVWKQIFKSMWKDFETCYRAILARLRQHGQMITLQAGLLCYEQTNLNTAGLADQIREIEMKLEDNKKMLEVSEYDRVKRQKIAVREWINGVSPEPIHNDACQVRCANPGTGDWIVFKDKIKDWMSADTPRYPVTWMHGIPGAGKTVLASVIIEHCRQRTAVTSYFYCKYGDPQANNCSSILRGLLFQLLEQHQDLIPYFFDQCSQGFSLALTSEATMKGFIDLFVQRGQRHYFIVDGLDECLVSERRAFLSFFNSLVEKREQKDPGQVRLLVVSQDENDIRRVMSKAEIVSLEAKDNKDDITLFVSSWTKKIKEKHELSDDQARFIFSSTCHLAQGMFLYAKLVMENLYAQPDRLKLEAEITESAFPKGIHEAYQRIMDRIKRDHHNAEWEMLLKLLGWMICAQRPLRWREMQGVLSINLDDESIDRVNISRVHIRDISGSLVKVLGDDQLVLVHSTASRYITSTEHITQAVVQCELATLIFKYLTFDCFATLFDHDEFLDCYMPQGYFAIADYAVAKWPDHLRAVVTTDFSEDEGHKSKQLIDAFATFGEAADDFLRFFDADFAACPVEMPVSFPPNQEQSPQAIEKLNDFLKSKCGTAFVEVEDIVELKTLKSLWRHIENTSRLSPDLQNQISLPELNKIFQHVRQKIEEVVELVSECKLPAGHRQILDLVQGSKHYKCSKLRCYYFHEGFETATDRKAHLDRHERPFTCTFNDCMSKDFGFASKKELHSHISELHSEEIDRTLLFPKTPPTLVQSKWKCETCGKSFTRGKILRDHRLSHQGLRPHACNHCGRAFTRKSDLNRHEKKHNRHQGS